MVSAPRRHDQARRRFRQLKEAVENWGKPKAQLSSRFRPKPAQASPRHAYQGCVSQSAGQHALPPVPIILSWLDSHDAGAVKQMDWAIRAMRAGRCRGFALTLLGLGARSERSLRKGAAVVRRMGEGWALSRTHGGSRIATAALLAGGRKARGGAQKTC